MIYLRVCIGVGVALLLLVTGVGCGMGAGSGGEREGMAVSRVKGYRTIQELAADSDAVLWTKAASGRSASFRTVSRIAYSMIRWFGSNGARSSNPREWIAILISSASDTPVERRCFRR